MTDASGLMSANLDDLLGQSFLCSECGREHKIETKCLVIGEDADLQLLSFLKDEGLAGAGISGKGLLVCDLNTEEYGRKLALEIFAGLEAGEAGEDPDRERQAHGGIELFVFPQAHPHTDEYSIGRLMQAMAFKPTYLIACGSGTMTDIVRYCAYMADIPFIVYATAASVDGFASGSTPMIVDGFKITYPGKAPVGIFADTGLLARAPRQMTAAGFGDVLAKLPGLLDWKLAAKVEGEPFCPFIYRMVKEAAEESVDLGKLLIAADPVAIGRLMEVLTVTGLAMQMMGTTRPASGGEHQISHILEMRDIQEGKEGSLHGDKVGVASLVAIYMYGRLFLEDDPDQQKISLLKRPEEKAHMPEDIWRREVSRVYGKLAARALEINPASPPTGERWEKEKEMIFDFLQQEGIEDVKKYYDMLGDLAEIIRAMGGPATADELGISENLIYDALAFGKEVRPKYSILRIAESFGHLYEIAKEIAKNPEIVI